MVVAASAGFGYPVSEELLLAQNSESRRGNVPHQSPLSLGHWSSVPFPARGLVLCLARAREAGLPTATCLGRLAGAAQRSGMQIY